MYKNISLIKFFGITGLCLFISVNAFSQNYSVIDLEDLLASPNQYVNEVDRDEVEEIRTLVYDLNSMILIGNSGSRVFGNEAPVVAESTTDNLQALTASNPQFTEVQLLKLKIEEQADLNANLNLSSLGSFQNLKYIFVECSIECNSNRIKNMFSNVENVTILYIVSIPE